MSSYRSAALTTLQSMRRLHWRAVFMLALVWTPWVAADTGIEGWLYTVYGDGQNGSGDSQLSAYLFADDNQRYALRFAADAFPLHRALQVNSGERVRLSVSQVESPTSQSSDDTSAGHIASPATKEDTSKLPELIVHSIHVVETKMGRAFGRSSVLAAESAQSKRYVSLLCKFSDVASEAQPIGFFDAMYGDAPGQLGHYWRQVSSEAINLVGSRAYGGTSGNNGWFTMAGPRSKYISPTREVDLGLLFDDCVAAADPFVDFATVDGINLMFNAETGCCAWGGGWFANLDGVERVFPTTWEPDWAWSDVAVLAHEIGHSFGLPHSNNSDEDRDPYDSPWTVMSYPYSDFTDPVFGNKGAHLNAYEKFTLGWIVPSELYRVPKTGLIRRIKLSFLDRARATAGAYRMAIFAINNNRYFTVEARRRGGVYEGLPGSAVIIHSVDEQRTEPSWVVDGRSPPANFADVRTVMWQVGEEYVNPQFGISMKVIAQDATGFTVDVFAEGQLTVLPAISLLLDEDSE